MKNDLGNEENARFTEWVDSYWPDVRGKPDLSVSLTGAEILRMLAASWDAAIVSIEVVSRDGQRETNQKALKRFIEMKTKNSSGPPFDDSEPVLAALAALSSDTHATDNQRRIARMALHEMLRLRAAHQSVSEQAQRDRARFIATKILRHPNGYPATAYDIERAAAIIEEEMGKTAGEDPQKTLPPDKS